MYFFISTQINLNIEEQYISESFLWDVEDTSIARIKDFSNHFLIDLLTERGIELEKEAYAGKDIFNV